MSKPWAILVIVPGSTITISIVMAVTVTIAMSIPIIRWVVIYHMNLFHIFWS